MEEVRQIGHSVWHFRRHVDFPPKPKIKIEQNIFFFKYVNMGTNKLNNYMLIPNPKSEKKCAKNKK